MAPGSIDGGGRREARERPDLLDPRSPPDLRVVQLTTDRQFASGHVYMESRVFTPDSRRLLYLRYRSPAPEFAVAADLMLCDLEEGFLLRRLTDEPGVRAPSMAPDGSCVYYVRDEGRPGRGRLEFKRVLLDSGRRETLRVLDTPPPGLQVVPSRVYPLSSISEDGRRLAIGAFLGDGQQEQAPWGALVFDLNTLALSVALEGPEYLNPHPQYCRHPTASRDLLIQHNHGARTDRAGEVVELWAGDGADLHVVRDDGTDFRSLAIGRDGVEICQGHQCWRGTGRSVVASVFRRGIASVCGGLVEALPVGGPQSQCHAGAGMRDVGGAGRHDISREIPGAAFSHFAFDPTGTRFVSDWIEDEQRWEDGRLVLGSLDTAPDATLRVRHLLHPRAPYDRQVAHPHPFLSPDGQRVFFNSEYGGVPQIWMAEGLAFP